MDQKHLRGLSRTLDNQVLLRFQSTLAVSIARSDKKTGPMQQVRMRTSG